MATIPSGIPIPTPIAVSGLVEYSSVWGGTGGPVNVLAKGDSRTIVDFKFVSAEKVMFTRLLGLSVGADGEYVTNGYPKI